MLAIISFKAFGRGILNRLERFPKKRKQRRGSSYSLLVQQKRFPQPRTSCSSSSASSSENDVSSESLQVVSQQLTTGADTAKVILELQDIDHIDTSTGIYCITGPGPGPDISILSISLLKKIESWLAETIPPDSCLDEKRALIAQDNLEALFDCALALYEAAKRPVGENGSCRNFLTSEDIQKVIATSVSQTANPEFRERLLQTFLGSSYIQSLATGYIPRNDIQPGIPDEFPSILVSRDQLQSEFPPSLLTAGAQHNIGIVTQTQPAPATAPATATEGEPCIDIDVANSNPNSNGSILFPQFNTTAIRLEPAATRLQYLGPNSTEQSSPEYEDTRLHDAIRRDDLLTVQRLLKNRFDIFEDNVHTTITRLPINAIACCVKYRRKDILSYLISRDIKCYPTAIWETLRYGDTELREFIIAKYEERKRQFNPFKEISYRDRFAQHGPYSDEYLGYFFPALLPKPPTRSITYSDSTPEQWGEDFDTNLIGTPNSYLGGGIISQSELNIEEYHEGHYNSGSGVFDDLEGTEEDEEIYQEEGRVDELDEDKDKYEEEEEGGGYEGYEEEGEGDEDEDEDGEGYNNYQNGERGGGTVERPLECIDGGESFGGHDGHSMDPKLRTSSGQQANRATGKRSHSQRENNDGNDGNDGSQNGPPHKRHYNCEGDDLGPLGCPLYKLYPALYPQCSRIGRKNLSGIKEHLRRNHFKDDTPEAMFKNKTEESLLEFLRTLMQDLGMPSSTQPAPSTASFLPPDKASTVTQGASPQAHAYADQFLNSTPYQPGLDLSISSMGAPDIMTNAMVEGGRFENPASKTIATPDQEINTAGSINAMAAQYNTVGHQQLLHSSQRQFIPAGPELDTQALICPATSEVPHTRPQLDPLSTAPIRGLGHSVYNRIENSPSQGASLVETNSPRNDPPVYLEGDWMPQKSAYYETPVAGSTGRRVLSPPFQPESTQRVRQFNASQDPCTTTNPDLLYGLSVLHPKPPTSESTPQKAGNISLPPPTPLPHSRRSSSLATVDSSPCLLKDEIKSVIQRSYQESVKTFVSAWGGDLGPANSILSQNKSTTEGSVSPSLLSLNRKASTTVTSDVDTTAVTPQFPNPPVSPHIARPSRNQEKTIKIRLEQPQEEPGRKKWYEFKVSNGDDIKRDFDRLMTQTFQPLGIPFSWDEWDLLGLKSKERACNIEELVEELVETQWGGYGETESRFYLVRK
ncbi:hypothetical protein TWF506_007145 [Arthrobotrys conoides]|uniref:Uncharacterized protein n=1 Tax=Arthrobotrys conoides TaxID=74498 RepID=A0AAN8RN11_9PEZI